MTTETSLPHVEAYRLWRTPAQGRIVSTFVCHGVEIAAYEDNGKRDLRVLWPENPSPIASITVERYEGPICDCDKPRRFTTYEDAQQQLNEWGHTAPKQGDGYDKTRFVIEWDDGTKYEGRFDLNIGGMDSEKNLRDSFRERVFFYSGLRCPWHLTETDYRQCLNELHAEVCRHILANCEL